MKNRNRKSSLPWAIMLVLFVLLSVSLAQPAAAQPAAAPAASSQYLPLTLKGFKTGVGEVVGKVINAQTSNPVQGIKMCFTDTICTNTGTDGTYKLSQIPTGWREIMALPTGVNYSQVALGVQIRANQTVTLNFALSPPLQEGQMRVVLTWDPTPYYTGSQNQQIENDQDAYLWVPASPNPISIYWNNPGNCYAAPFACLEKDVRTGNGPETLLITLGDIGVYTYAVWDYAYASNAAYVPPLTQSSARVQVYTFTGLAATFDVPSTGTGAWWYVFDVDGATKDIIVKNVIMDGPPIHKLEAGTALIGGKK